MLSINTAQMKVFEEASLRSFEDEMVLHSQEFSPKLCEVIGEDQLRIALRQAIKRADSYGFTLKGPIRLYIELMFLFGSDFDTDPQFPTIAEILQSDVIEMERAEKIREWVLDYNKSVNGKNNANVYSALKKLSYFSKSEFNFTDYSFKEEIHQEMQRAFPQKIAFIGREKLGMLIDDACAKAQSYNFNTIRGQSTIVVLMFAFGRGCVNDPLYPWIFKTLKNPKIRDSITRQNKLERKSITWLDHVLKDINVGR